MVQPTGPKHFAFMSVWSTSSHCLPFDANFIVSSISVFQSLGFWIFLFKIIGRGVPEEFRCQDHSCLLSSPLISVEILVMVDKTAKLKLFYFSQFSNESTHPLRIIWLYSSCIEVCNVLQEAIYFVANPKKS